MAFHNIQSQGEIHTILQWVVANAAARTTLSLVATDLGKACLQLDTADIWVVANVTGPVWKQVTNSTTGVTWGSIGGTLSGQTDLATVLGTKQDTSTIAETIDDRVAALLVAGSNVTLTYNDVANTLTVASTGSAGMSNPMTSLGDIIYGAAAGAPARLAAGANGDVLTYDTATTKPKWAAPSGGGSLTGFTSALTTSAPNTSINVSSLTASGGAGGDQDVVFAPKGGGAILADIPDNTTAGGNKRGFAAVDLQTQRSSANQVAAATGSVILGGDSNTISSTGVNAVALGVQNNITGARGIALGYKNIVDGTEAVGLGSGSKSRGEAGVLAFSTSSPTAGERQQTKRILKHRTTNATPTKIGSAGAAPSATTVPVLPSYALYSFTCNINAGSFLLGTASAWVIEGVVKSVGGSAVMVGTPIIRMIGQDAGAAAWGVAATINAALNSLEIQVTGGAGTTIDWTATLDITEAVI